MRRFFLKKGVVPTSRPTKRGVTGIALLSLLTGASLLITGCGPGFPIMTSEQEELVSNVDKLMQERSVIKDKVSAIEESGAAASELEDTRISLADSKAEMGKIHDQLSFINSSFEENELSVAQLKADMETINEKVDSVSTQLSGVESALDNIVEQVTSATAASETESIRSTELASAVDTLQGRLDSLEKLVSSNSKMLKQSSKTTRKSGTSAAKPDSESQTPKSLYEKGLRETKEKKYNDASKTFKAFLTSHRSHELADNAQYWLGEIFYDTGAYERAILEFDKVITDYPEGDKRPAATLKQGFSFDKLGAAKEARVLLESVVELYPESEEATKAKKRLKKMKAE